MLMLPHLLLFILNFEFYILNFCNVVTLVTQGCTPVTKALAFVIFIPTFPPKSSLWQREDLRGNSNERRYWEF